LASTVTELVLYPYWNVPDKIARKELLPLIKRTMAYLSINNFQVLSLQGRLIDPAQVNWKAMSATNFPYRLRQSTGCDNSLGLIKLNFYSPFGVYLHDTPLKILFEFNKPYLSHGCVRLQKAKELARYVAGNNTLAVDTISEENCLKNQAPVIVPASKPIPVFVLYHTVWPDSAGRVRFYEDPYGKIRPQRPPIKK
jgi:L,D-transpeptidase YcbB